MASANRSVSKVAKSGKTTAANRTPTTRKSAAWNSDSATLAAILDSQAVIEFDLEGNILTANDCFLSTMGYSQDELVGRHHSTLVDPATVSTFEYREFWSRLARGEAFTGTFRRVAKGGREVWLEASYKPVFGKNGKPTKVVEIAADVTANLLKNSDFEAQVTAINRVQAVIEFNLDGTIRTANENFLATLGYSLAEIQGRHHSMFVEPENVDTPEYREFWNSLRRGEFKSGEFRRVGKGNKRIWIQASYNPIFDQAGRVIKVVKFATDITASKLLSEAAIRDAAENAKMRAMMDNMAASVTYADKNNIITYANPAAIELLRKVEKHLPVKVEEIVGKSIDIFHKNPRHQQSIISNERNFPFAGQIRIADEHFMLRASRIRDENGNFLGRWLAGSA